MITLILLDIVVWALLVIDALKFRLPEAKGRKSREHGKDRDYGQDS